VQKLETVTPVRRLSLHASHPTLNRKTGQLKNFLKKSIPNKSRVNLLTRMQELHSSNNNGKFIRPQRCWASGAVKKVQLSATSKAKIFIAGGWNNDPQATPPQRTNKNNAHMQHRRRVRKTRYVAARQTSRSVKLTHEKGEVHVKKHCCRNGNDGANLVDTNAVDARVDVHSIREGRERGTQERGKRKVSRERGREEGEQQRNTKSEPRRVSSATDFCHFLLLAGNSHARSGAITRQRRAMT